MSKRLHRRLCATDQGAGLTTARRPPGLERLLRILCPLSTPRRSRRTPLASDSERNCYAMKRLAFCVIAAVATLAAVGPARAITGGELDGNNHPNVALIYFYQPD